MMFRVGQKIVCIWDSWCEGWDVVPNRPIKDNVYTIRAMVPWTWPQPDGPEIALLLEEIINESDEWDGIDSAHEHPFAQDYFRPLITIETFIQEINSIPVPETVDG